MHPEELIRYALNDTRDQIPYQFHVEIELLIKNSGFPSHLPLENVSSEMFIMLPFQVIYHKKLMLFVSFHVDLSWNYCN